MEILDISISTKEILLMVIISFIGSFLHEYIVSIKRNNIRKISSIAINICITVLIDVIICISIDEIVIEISPRLILLPPLILGLVGKELVESLATLKASTRLIAFIFSLFGSGNGEGVEIDEELDSNEENSEEPSQEEKEQKIKNFEEYTEKVLSTMNSLIVSYARSSIDDNKFIEKYNLIKINAKLIKQQVKNSNVVTLEEALRISEIVKNEDYLDQIYRGIQNKRSIIT